MHLVSGEGLVGGDGRCRWVVVERRLSKGFESASERRGNWGAARLAVWVGLGQGRAQSLYIYHGISRVAPFDIDSRFISTL